MGILITSSRMPFALDAIRKLGERGEGHLLIEDRLGGILSSLAE